MLYQVIQWTYKISCHVTSRHSVWGGGMMKYCKTERIKQKWKGIKRSYVCWVWCMCSLKRVILCTSWLDGGFVLLLFYLCIHEFIPIQKDLAVISRTSPSIHNRYYVNCKPIREVNSHHTLMFMLIFEFHESLFPF